LTHSATRRFHRLCLTTLIAVYFLVLAGGVVRATGSGMGCPDWPTCFGSWIPPTGVDQLPPDYKEQYASYRDKKNIKFASFLASIGMDQTANKIRTDKSILVEADFNAAKTWVEYINRLIGVAVGLLIIALFALTWSTRREFPALFVGTFALLILVLIQGWFGSIVVSTNLTPWTVTVHMFLALVMVMLLVWLGVNSGPQGVALTQPIRPLILAGMGAYLIQIFLGTNVRAALDRLSAAAVARAQWISGAGTEFIIHRSFSWVLILIQVGIYYWLRKSGAARSSYLVMILLLLTSLLTGTAMAYFNVPALMQPMHLLVAFISVGWMYQLYLQTSVKRTAEVVV
jgi:heme a synthase